MDQQKQPSQTQKQLSASGTQNAGHVAVQNANPLSLQQQRRPSATSAAGSVPGNANETLNGSHLTQPSNSCQPFPQNQHPQNSPVPSMYVNRPSQSQNQQLSHIQMTSLGTTQPIQHQVQHMNVQNQQQYQQYYNMQQQQQFVSQPPPPQNVLSPIPPLHRNVGQQSQPSSLNPSPISQPAMINPNAYPVGHQQQHVVLQPILNYQPQQQQLMQHQPIQQQQQIQQQMYNQQAVAMIQPQILYTNAALVTSGQAVMAPQQSVISPESSTGVAPPPGSPSEVVKRGRFRVTKGGKSLKNALENASSTEVSGQNEAAENVSENGSTAGEGVAPVQPDASIKKKGRFVVKTAAAAVGTSNNTAKSTVSAAAGERTTDKTPNPVKTEVKNEIKNADDSVEVSTAGNEKKKAVETSASTISDNITNKPAEPPSVSTKKKGRFVVKTGGNVTTSLPATAPQETASLDGSTSKQSVPSVVSTITNSFPAADAAMSTSAQVHPTIAAPPYQTQTVYASQIANPVAVNMSMPISNIQAAQTLGALDMNGSYVLVSAPIMAPQNLHAQPTQPTIAPHSTTTPLQSNPLQPGGTTNVGVQPQQPTLRQPPGDAPEAHMQKKSASIPKVPRPADTVRPSIGGRLFGTVGVGKVLHYLESVRLEVVEADKSLASLQSENRILKDKNKELEAKNARLERQLAEERAKNRKLQQNAKSVDQNALDSNEASRKKTTVSKSRSNSVSDGPTVVDKETSEIEASAPSSDASSPAKKLSAAELMPTKRNHQCVPEPNQQSDNPQREIGSKSISAVDPSSNCTSAHVKQPSLLSSFSSTGAPEISYNAAFNETACNLIDANTTGSTPQQFAVLSGFDPLGTVANGAVVVPVLVPSPQTSEKDVKRFDPLGTPKRSGSKVLTNASYSELNILQQVSAYPAQTNGVPAVMSIQPVQITAAAPMVTPFPLNAQLPDPFDEIARRHGVSQHNGNE